MSGSIICIIGQRLIKLSKLIGYQGDKTDGKKIKAPMPGTIVEVMVNSGDKITKHQEVIILESMKMETPIVAEDEGTVKKVLVTANDTVAVNQILVVVE